MARPQPFCALPLPSVEMSLNSMDSDSVREVPRAWRAALTSRVARVCTAVRRLPKQTPRAASCARDRVVSMPRLPTSSQSATAAACARWRRSRSTRKSVREGRARRWRAASMHSHVAAMSETVHGDAAARRHDVKMFDAHVRNLPSCRCACECARASMRIDVRSHACAHAIMKVDPLCSPSLRAGGRVVRMPAGCGAVSDSSRGHALRACSAFVMLLMQPCLQGVRL